MDGSEAEERERESPTTFRWWWNLPLECLLFIYIFIIILVSPRPDQPRLADVLTLLYGVRHISTFMGGWVAINQFCVCCFDATLTCLDGAGGKGRGSVLKIFAKSASLVFFKKYIK